MPHNGNERAIKHYRENRHLFDTFAGLLGTFRGDPTLSKLIHFSKFRTKDPDHLEGKLIRKLTESGGQVSVDEGNIFDFVDDLAGVRLIHLHTEQIRDIHRRLLDVFAEQTLTLVEEPTELLGHQYQHSGAYGIRTRSRESMYTTVHYIIKANQRTNVKCEVQVRTLLDEVWGEVSHRIDYPTPTEDESCKDQLKVLAD